jgi:hypothetical protein
MSTRSQTIENMTAVEVIDAMRADTPLSRVRKIFAEESARMEQAVAQRNPHLGIIEIRKMEFHAANRILDLFGIAVP